MTSYRLILRGLLHHRRENMAVAIAVAVATSVLTGALFIGDSMRGSLRDLTLERLGRIDQMLLVDRFIQEELADQLVSDQRFDAHFSEALPLILFPRGSAEQMEASQTLRARRISVIGCNPSFWDLGIPKNGHIASPNTFPSKGSREVILNAPLAEELGATVGDEITLRLPTFRAVPADSPLGEREQLQESLPRLKVIAIVPAEGLGRFSLAPDQSLPRCAFLDLAFLQKSIDQIGKVNAIAVATERGESPSAPTASEILVEALEPSLEDYGLRLATISRSWTDPLTEVEQSAYTYFHLTTDRMMLSPPMEEAAMHALADREGVPIFTYLANDLQVVDPQGEPVNEGIPYSTIAAVDWNTDTLGPLLTTEGAPMPPLLPNEIALNRWAQMNCGAAIGDTIQITYFDPETTHGEPKETSARFVLAAVIDLVEPVQPYSRRGDALYHQPPLLANDPDFTPLVEGITDQASIDAWEAPFPIDYNRIRSDDDDYWAAHRTTPKAFISLSAGRKLWGSRFGSATSIRIPPPEDLDREGLERLLLESLAEEKETLGFRFLSVKREGLEASAGTTPFAILFLLFSLFVIGAAVMLIALLYRLGMESRAEQLGLLLALGIPRKKVARLFLGEGLLTALVGAILGGALGVGYAALLIAGLHSWWLDAVVVPFLSLHISPQSLLAGPCLSIGISMLAMRGSIRRLSHFSASLLLGGGIENRDSSLAKRSSSKARRIMGVACFALFVAALGLGYSAIKLKGEAQAGAFMGCGGLILAAWLLGASLLLERFNRTTRKPLRSLLGLALQNGARHPLRSALTMGLIASSCFLVMATTVFHLEPSLSGAGGFSLLAESDRPIFADLNSEAGKVSLLGENAAEALDGVTILTLRAREGEDASCRNLYQTMQPRLLGITPPFYEYYDAPRPHPFTWAERLHAAEAMPNPWRSLLEPLQDDQDCVPVILDKNMAMYSLHLYGGVGEKFSLDYQGKEISFVVTGLLSNSIFQGSLLVDEEALLTHFPEVSGYPYFLIDPGAQAAAPLTAALESALSDEGFDIQDSEGLLEELLAVQNAYLSTFQSLGLLGLLLGTLGMAAVQIRNIFCRRGELALLRAAGFCRRRIASLVFYEHLILLAGGLFIGFSSALAAVAPHLFVRGDSLPTGQILTMLVLLLVVGSAAGLVGIAVVIRLPLLASLRKG